MLYMLLWAALLAALVYLYSTAQSKIATRWLPGGKPLGGNAGAGIIVAATVVIVVALNLIYTIAALVAVVAVLFSAELFVGGLCRLRVDALDKRYDQLPADKQLRAKRNYFAWVCVLVVLRLGVLWLSALGMLITWVKYY